ncbi:hypothetical protein CLOM_g8663 [Closterium sp. NIES-68]|nr:hypothetical protein CLOM_g8663 [Closterium sp. NIES-68]GJP80124.1 hypothetical protein CLOP_g10352 [Closterium sp. NIES-67]
MEPDALSQSSQHIPQPSDPSLVSHDSQHIAHSHAHSHSHSHAHDHAHGGLAQSSLPSLPHRLHPPHPSQEDASPPLPVKAGRLSSLGHAACSSSCLADMRAASPPRARAHSSSSDDALLRHSAGAEEADGAEAGVLREGEEGAEGVVVVGDGVVVDVERVRQAQYDAWLEEHPSAVAQFERVAGAVGARQVALFLDYDGTLAPIVDNPDHAFMPSGMRAAVREAARHFPTAIISGRGREKVYEFVQLPELYYAGSHGMDIMLPAHAPPSAPTPSPTAASAPAPSSAAPHDVPADGRQENGALGVTITGDRCTDANNHEVVVFQPASDFAQLMGQVYGELVHVTAGVAGSLVENNKFAVTVHFRRVAEECWEHLAGLVEHVVQQHPRLRLSHGRKVFEVRPVVDWDKGKAVQYLLTTLGLNNSSAVMPVYIGDDRTDEDAFQMLQERGSGLGIIVSAAAKSSVASYSLRDPSEVLDFLHKLVRWKEGSGSLR